MGLLFHKCVYSGDIKMCYFLETLGKYDLTQGPTSNQQSSTLGNKFKKEAWEGQKGKRIKENGKEGRREGRGEEKKGKEKDGPEGAFL